MAQNIKTIQGVARASVKTIQGIAIASIKTIQGVDNTGGAGAAFSYDFTGTDGAEWDSAKFTEVNGSVNILSNTGRFVTGGFGLDASMYTGGTCSTANQYHKLTTVTVPTSSFLQLIFRYTNSSSPFYTAEIDTDTGTVAWYRWADLAAFIAGSGTTIHAATTITGAGDANDAYGITLEGTGTGTVLRAWLNPTADTPTSASVFGANAADLTYTDDPASPVDSGGSLGIACFQSTANGQRIDGWFGGDIP